ERAHPGPHPCPTRRSSDLAVSGTGGEVAVITDRLPPAVPQNLRLRLTGSGVVAEWDAIARDLPGDSHAYYRLYRSDDEPLLDIRSEEHTSELQSRENLVCR